MQKRQSFWPFFVTFFCLSILLIFLGRTGLFNSIVSILNKSIIPLQQSTYNIFTFSGLENKYIEKLVTENSDLRKKMIDHENLVKENEALKDQFNNTLPKSTNLIPADIVGSPGFIPGITIPDYLIINQGKKSGVKTGSAVVVKNNLIGIVSIVNDDFSKINLITEENISITSQVQNPDGANDITGIIKGKGNYEMTLDNVLLSKELKKDMVVLTLSDIDENGRGIPGNLVIGRLISIDKKPSDLFQKAEVRSFVDFKNLKKVFVVI